jgi:hypothetical protein
LDVFKDVLAKFGGELAGEHAAILTTLTKLLEHPNESVRKRTTVTIGPLVVSLTEENFASLMTSMIKKIESSRKPDIYIQTIGSVSQAGMSTTYHSFHFPTIDTDNQQQVTL